MDNNQLVISYQNDGVCTDDIGELVDMMELFSVFISETSFAGSQKERHLVNRIFCHNDKAQILAAASCVAYKNSLAQAVVERLSPASSAFHRPSGIAMSIEVE